MDSMTMPPRDLMVHQDVFWSRSPSENSELGANVEHNLRDQVSLNQELFFRDWKKRWFHVWSAMCILQLPLCV